MKAIQNPSIKQFRDHFKDYVQFAKEEKVEIIIEKRCNKTRKVIERYVFKVLRFT